MTRILSASALCCLLGCRSNQPAPRPAQQELVAATAVPPPAAKPDSPVTHVEMHNVIIHVNDSFRLQIRWLRGELLPARAGVTPSFDDKSSLLFQIEAGVVHASARDLTNLFNQRVFAYKGSPLSNVTLTTQGAQVKLTGTLHKGVSLPIAMVADLSATGGGQIRVHPLKLSALHVPVKALLNGLGIHIGDLIDTKSAKGISVDGNDVILDLDQILPPPRQRGRITAVHVSGNDIVEIYGTPRDEVVKARQWKNFIAFQGGSLRFGKLTMQSTDMTMIDTSHDPWFDFFLDHYQEQLQEGFIKTTASEGLQIFMPGYGSLRRK